MTLASIFRFERVMQPRYALASTTMKSIKEEILALIQRVDEGLAVLNEVDSPYAGDMKKIFLETYDIGAAMAKRNQLEAEEQNRRLYQEEMARRKAEQEAQEKAEREAREAYVRANQELMASIIYCEAGNQPYEGQVAVGAVIMNRVKSGCYPNSIEEVIYQSGQFGPAATGWLNRVRSSKGYSQTALQPL